MSEKSARGFRRTVFIDVETDTFCSCAGDFYKVCPLRAAQNLDCFEAVVRISPIRRSSEEFDADELTKSLDESLKGLKSSLKGLAGKPRI